MTKIASSDWRAKRLSKIRTLIKQADPKVVVEQKYKMAANPKGIPVWYHDGMICTGETYKDHLRLTFAKGALLRKEDPKGLLNAHRAMVIYETDKLNEVAFKKLIRAAVALNSKGKSKPKTKVAKKKAR